MEFAFADRRLERLYTHNVGAEMFSAEIVTLFRRRVRHIEAAQDLNDLRKLQSVDHQRAGTERFLLGLSDTHDLLLSEEGKNPVNRIVIHRIIERKRD